MYLSEESLSSSDLITKLEYDHTAVSKNALEILSDLQVSKGIISTLKLYQNCAYFQIFLNEVFSLCASCF